MKDELISATDMGAEPLIAMVGFGEAARPFAAGWGSGAARKMPIFDIKSLDSAEAGSIRSACETTGVIECASMEAAVSNATAIMCLVTADQSSAAARMAAPHLRAGTLWLDGNSCSPGTKKAAASAVESVGSCYVDVAIMAPVYPLLHRTPILLSGLHADRACQLMSGLGMNARVVGPRIGQASSIKMIRSVMVKGMEALTAECLIAARRAGVDRDVLASLQASHPARQWDATSLYDLERMATHGRRRAAEMREVVATLSELHLPARMAAAASQWQDDIGELALRNLPNDLVQVLDTILEAL